MGASMGLGFLSWNWLPLLPIFVVYVISGVAETNRHTPSTWWRARRKSSPATWSSTPAWASRSSSWPSTPACG